MYNYYVLSLIEDECLDTHIRVECHIEEKKLKSGESLECKTFSGNAKEYYLFVVNDEDLKYIGYSENKTIPAISLEKFCNSSEQNFNLFRLAPIKKSFKGLKNRISPSKETIGKILGELKAIDSVDKIFSYPPSFKIKIKSNEE